MGRWAIDHLVVVVDDLEAAVTRATAAGFTVSAGGRHDAIPTANRLIAFADGSYLELLALREPGAAAALRARAAGPGWARHLHEATAVGRRFLAALAGPEGVADLCLTGADLGRWTREARARGTVVTGPTPMQRAADAGEPLAWRLALPAERMLPFAIEDLTPRARRVPAAPGAVRHPNGASGIHAVQVRVESEPLAALAWSEAFGCVPRVDPAGGTRLALARASVVLVAGAPVGAGGAALAGVAPEWALPEWGLRAAGP